MLLWLLMFLSDFLFILFIIALVTSIFVSIIHTCVLLTVTNTLEQYPQLIPTIMNLFNISTTLEYDLWDLLNRPSVSYYFIMYLTNASLSSCSQLWPVFLSGLIFAFCMCFKLANLFIWSTLLTLVDTWVTWLASPLIFFEAEHVLCYALTGSLSIRPCS